MYNGFTPTIRGTLFTEILTVARFCISQPLNRYWRRRLWNLLVQAVKP